MKKYILLTFSILLWISTSSQIQETFYSTADTWISEALPNNNMGSDYIAAFGYYSNGDIGAGLVKFDLSSIPSNATINSATLILKNASTTTSGAVNGAAWRVTSNWNESTTWGGNLVTYDNSVGGTISTTGTESSISISATSVVKKWIEDGYTNYGFALVPHSWSTYGNLWMFITREYTGTSNDPKLEVTYTVPFDITIENESISSSTLYPGDSFTASCEQWTTSGSPSIDPKVGYYLSSNSTCSTSDTYLGEDESSLSSSDLYDPESESLTIPSNTNPGTYYLCFIADHPNDYSESNENNNTKSIQFSVVDPCTSPISNVGNNSGIGETTLTCTPSGGSGGSCKYKWYSGTSCVGSVLSTANTLTVTVTGNYSCKVYIDGYETTCYDCDYGYADVTSYSVSISQPNSNSIWYIGSTYNITWNDNFNENVVIDLYQEQGAGAFGQIDQISSSTPSDGSYSWTIPSSLTPGIYGIDIHSTTNSDISDFTEGFSITIDPSIIETISSIAAANIYPNPASEEFTIQIETSKAIDLQLKLYNVFGQLLYEDKLGIVSGSYEKSVAVNNLPAGVYALQLGSKNGVVSQMIIVE